MKVKIVKLHENAVIPVKTHDENVPVNQRDFCYDVVATSCTEVAPNVYKYGIGLGFQLVREDSDIDNQNVVLDIDGRARSSVWKTGMILSNCKSTLDEGYTGEVFFVFYHIFPNMPKYEVGDRIAQIKIGRTEPMKFELVEYLDETARGANGYGSSGNRTGLR